MIEALRYITRAISQRNAAQAQVGAGRDARAPVALVFGISSTEKLRRHRLATCPHSQTSGFYGAFILSYILSTHNLTVITIKILF